MKIFQQSLAYLMIICFLCLPLAINAEEINDQAMTTTETNANEEYNGSYFKAEDTINVNKNIKGINLLLGNLINDNGTSDYGIYAANTININGIINNDLWVAGNIISFNKDSKVSRDAYIAGNAIYLSGTFGRDVKVAGKDVTIDNAIINGNVKFIGKNITIGDNVKIIGTVKINKNAIQSISSKASLGEIILTKEIDFDTHFNVETYNPMPGKIVMLANLIVLFVLMLWLFPAIFKKIEKIIKDAEIDDYLKLSGTGLLILILLPIAAIIALCTIIGLSISIISFVFYVLIIGTAKIFAGYIVGRTLGIKIFKNIKSKYLIGMTGIVLLFIACQLPIIGWFFSFISILISLGLMYKLISNSKND